MEFCQCRERQSQAIESLGDVALSKFLRQVTQVIAHYHSLNISHNGICPENILIGESAVPKLTMFSVNAMSTIPSDLEGLGQLALSLTKKRKISSELT